MARTPNPVRRALLVVGIALSRLGLVDRTRVERATDLSWPRIVTGIALRSRAAVDVAMVGVAVGPVAIAGLGFATPFWATSFSVGRGIAGGTISLVSQRYGAGEHRELAVVVRASLLLVVVLSVPFAAVLWALPGTVIGVIGTGAEAIELGAAYLRVLSLGVPFVAINLVWSRTLVGADDAWTPMVLRSGGAIVNVVANAILIFGLGFGVVGAAMGTVLGEVLVTVVFAVGLARGRLPFVGPLPVRVSPVGRVLDRRILQHLVEIGTPLLLARLADTSAQFLKIFLVGLFGPGVLAAFVIAMRVRGLMITPGYGFGLASSSLVGQALGEDDESAARAWASDMLWFALAVYVLIAIGVAAFAEPIARAFVGDPALLPMVTLFIYGACLSAVFQGVTTGATGPLRASGDTRWPFYGELAGRYVVALPIIALGLTPLLGPVAIVLAIVAEMLVPAAVTLFRYRSGSWLAVSVRYRPNQPSVD